MLGEDLAGRRVLIPATVRQRDGPFNHRHVRESGGIEDDVEDVAARLSIELPVPPAIPAI